MEKYVEPIIHDLFIAIRMHIPRSNSNFDLKKKPKHPDKGLKHVNGWNTCESVWLIYYLKN